MLVELFQIFMASKKSEKDNLEVAIKNWARKHFENNASCKERSLLKNEAIAMDIDWKRVRFDDDPPVYTPQPPLPGTGISTNHVLFNTTFTNRTDHEQNFSFKTERTTRSSCTVEVEQGCVTGAEMSVKLTTPCEFLEINAGFKREMALVNTDSQTTEEELTWGVDSQVRVKAGHTAEAKLVILEEEYKGAFEVTTRISGVVRVVMRNIKKNNSFMRATEGSVYRIVSEAIEKGLYAPTDALSLDRGSNTIVVATKGQCKFRYGLKQTVEVDQKSIV